jgi:HAE1 family hydrophobic/amphiphilic exporter-1
MNALLGPIIGITLVLMSVFVPAAFLPGLTGRLYAQFALVIAGTALISAVNAATLKPTQCALWLRRQVPPEERNALYRGFNAAYGALERRYAGLIRHMVRHSGSMVVAALAIMTLGVVGIASAPTGFLPLEDQGYLLVSLQLPDGASLERTQRTLDRVGELARKVPGVAQVIGIAGVSVLDNNAPLPNGGVVYAMLKDWSTRSSGEDLRSLYGNLTAALSEVADAEVLVIPPPAIQGIGNSGGFTMTVELRDGSNDFAGLQAMTDLIVDKARAQGGLQRTMTSFRADAPQLSVVVDRVKAETLHVSPGDIFQTVTTYLGSSFAGQFTKFNRTFQIFVQADSGFRLRPDEIDNLTVRSGDGKMIPLGTLVRIMPAVGPSLVSLYNLHPAATIIGTPADGVSSGEALTLMERIAAETLPPGAGYDWTAMSYQEKAVGNQLYYVFVLAILLVYLVLAGQYESWIAPLSVVLAVPLALTGPAAVLWALGVANNLYAQIGLILLIALSAKNAILIVEVARDERLRRGADLLDAAVEAARSRLRPILMTSLAFMLGAVPLVLATGAGANARRSIGITVFSGMLASTCLAVLLVPSFFVVLQKAEEHRAAARTRSRARSPAE